MRCRSIVEGQVFRLRSFRAFVNNMLCSLHFSCIYISIYILSYHCIISTVQYAGFCGLLYFAGFGCVNIDLSMREILVLFFSWRAVGGWDCGFGGGGDGDIFVIAYIQWAFVVEVKMFVVVVVYYNDGVALLSIMVAVLRSLCVCDDFAVGEVL